MMPCTTQPFPHWLKGGPRFVSTILVFSGGSSVTYWQEKDLMVSNKTWLKSVVHFKMSTGWIDSHAGPLLDLVRRRLPLRCKGHSGEMVGTSVELLVSNYIYIYNIKTCFQSPPEGVRGNPWGHRQRSSSKLPVSILWPERSFGDPSRLHHAPCQCPELGKVARKGQEMLQLTSQPLVDWHRWPFHSTW